MRYQLSALLFACASLVGCKTGDALVVVTVNAQTPVDGVASLAIKATLGNDSPTFNVPTGQHTTISDLAPFTFGIQVPARLSGMITVDVEARDTNDKAITHASQSGPVRPGQRTDLTVSFGPTIDQDAGTDFGGDASPDLTGALAVAITNPSSTVYIKASVSIQVSVNGGTPDKVVLLRDDIELATLSAPYQFTWDTTLETEAAHMLVARATLNGQSYDSPPRTIVVDRTAPTVTMQSPAPAASNVDVSKPILVGFSEAVLPSSVNDATVTLSASPGPLAKSLSLSADGMTLTVVPTPAPALPATVTATLTSGITDLAGNALIPPAGAWSWDVPFWVQLGSAVNPAGAADALLPQVASDPMGNLYLALSESPSAYVQSWTDASGSWTALGGKVDADTNALVDSQIALALDGSGLPVVAFEQPQFMSTSGIYVRRWNGSSWATMGSKINLTANNTIQVGAGAPGLGFDKSGVPYVAFLELGSFVNMYVAHWDGVSSWVATGGAINANAGTSISQTSTAIGLAMDTTVPTPRPVVTFTEHGTRENVYVYRWENQATWNYAGGADSINSRDATYPRVAVDTFGRPVGAFRENDGTHFNAYVTRWDAAIPSALGGAINPVGAADIFAESPGLVLDSSSFPIVAMSESDGTRRKIYVVRWSGSTTWPLLGNAIDLTMAGDARDPSLTFDAKGRLVVAFAQNDGNHFNIYVVRQNQ